MATTQLRGNAKLAYYSAMVYRDYKTPRLTWIEQISKDRDYYLNKQWTKRQESELKARGQAPLVINRIYPVVQQKLAQLGIHKPVIKAVPVEETDNEKAQIWSSVIEYVLQRSKFNLVDLDVKRNHIIGGVGYYYVYVDKYADDGKGEITVASLPPEIVYIDPNSRQPDYSDASHILVTQTYTLQQAKAMFPGDAAKLELASGQDVGDKDYFGTNMYSGENMITPDQVEGIQNMTYSKDAGKYVRIIERYTKAMYPYYMVTGPDDFSDVVDESTYKSTYKDSKVFEAVKIFRTKVHKVVSAGLTVFLGKEVLNIDEYPIVPAPNVWVGTPFPASDVRFLRGIQDEINKRRSLMILHATSVSSPKWMHEEGAVDPKIWDNMSQVPGARLPYRAGYEKPAFVFPVPLPNAFMQLEGNAMHDVEYTSGVFAMSHGDSSAAPETYAATLALEEYAGRRLQPSLEILGNAKRQIGRVIIGLSQDLYTLPKMIRIYGEEGKVTEVMINSIAGMDSDGKMVMENALDQSRYDVIIQSGNFSPTNRMAHSQMMLALAKEGLVDNVTLLESLDFRGRDKAIERAGQIAQLQRAMNAEKQYNKQLEGLNQTLRRELQQAGIKSVVDEYRNLEKSELLETKAQQKVLRGQMQLENAAQETAFELKLRELEIQAREKEASRNRKAGSSKE